MKRQYNTILQMMLHGSVTLVLLVLAGCEEFIKIDPPKTEIVTETVFTSDASAMSAARGIYSIMMSGSGFANGALEEYTGIASDELISYAGRAEIQQFYQNTIVATNDDVLGYFWRDPFRYISNANALLEGLENSTGMTTAMKEHLEGEAKFTRAFCHFYLVNLFGESPYLKDTDYRVNAVAARLSVDDVYERIESDLLDAQALMAEDFSMSANERIQPNKGAATALLARLYLYRGEWERAEAEATKLINNTTLYALVTDLNSVFLKNSTETIWQLRPVIPGLNTYQGQLFILTAPPNNNNKRVSVTQGLYDAFEPTDNRRAQWVGSFTNGTTTWYFPHKYKVAAATAVTEYEMMLRLAEQYLIRAEARAQLENISGAQEDLNAIRSRAGLAGTDADDKAALLLAIEQERKAELFAECGHRWLDLKRTGRADAILDPLKTDWQSADALFPIPDAERELNPNLTQNDGY